MSGAWDWRLGLLVRLLAAGLLLLAVIAPGHALATVGYFETQTQSIDTSKSLNAVACVAATTTCVVADSEGKAFYAAGVSATVPAGWTPWAGPGAKPSHALACPSTSLCLLAAGEVGDGGGNLYRATALGGQFLTSFTPGNGVDTVSCPSASFCVTAQEGDGTIRYSTNPSKVSWIAVSIGSGAMTGVSCLSAAFCAAVDDSGQVLVATSEAGVKEATGWTTTDVDGVAALHGISCISTSECIAVDESGEVLRLAIDAGGAAAVSRQPVAGAAALTSISCLASTCAVGDRGGSVFASTDGGSTWRTRHGDSAAINGVSCASGTLCAAVSASGEVTAFNPATTVSPLVISTLSLPAGHAGTAYEAVAHAGGGDPPYQWSATGLPAGLSIDGATGRISGTPSTATCVSSPCPQPSAVYTPTVAVTDGNGTIASVPLVISLAGTDVRLRVSTPGDGSGEVTSSPAGIERCGAPGGVCEFSYEDTTTVTLVATAEAGSSFRGWSGGGCSGTGPCRVALNGDSDVTASFAKPPAALHSMTVVLAGGGSGVVTDSTGSIRCPGACSHAFAEGARLSLEPVAEPGSKFTGWSGGGCSGRGACSVSLKSDEVVTANFTKAPPSTKLKRARILPAGRVTFFFAASGGTRSFECALTGPGRRSNRFSRCSSPRAYPHLSPGRYLFRVRAVGPGGVDRTPAKRSFRIAD